MKTEWSPYFYRTHTGPMDAGVKFDIDLVVGGFPNPLATYRLNVFGGPKNILVESVLVGNTLMCISGQLDDLCRVTWHLMYGLTMRLQCFTAEPFEELVVELRDAKPLEWE